MIEANHWEPGVNNQWVFYAKDNSSLEGLATKININDLQCSTDSELVNLGIKRINGLIYSSNYVGVCRLKSASGKNISSFDGREVVLKIEPRFPISVVDMLNSLRDDDEFERYLAPQTNRLLDSIHEVEDLRENELFRFSLDEDPILLKDSISNESSIITASVFITMLKKLCSRPLMGRMIRNEENLVGKAKGKVVFYKNIRYNTLKGRDDRIYCRYLKYTEDIIENQVLKEALHKAELFLNRYFGSITGNKNSFRELVSFCNKALSHVSNKSISRLDLSGIRTTGVYVYYKPVIDAAKMVLSEITLEATGRSSVTSYVVPYSISMEKLFEMYVRAYFKKAGVRSFDSREDGIRISQYDEKTAVLKSKDQFSSTYIKGNIKPDIKIFDPETGKCIVFDVKYKAHQKTEFARSDRMQILAYGLMLGCANVGNIFPSQDGSNNTYYTQNQINSDDSQIRYYNQIEIAIDKTWTYEVSCKDNSARMSVLEYLKKLLSQ